MKNVLIITNIATLFILGFTYFSGCKKAEIDPEKATNTCIVCPNTKAYQQVSTDFVKSLLRNYRKNHWTKINASGIIPTSIDSRSVWFDMDVIKSFIADVEAKTDAICEEGHCNKKLGIRIYFGEYGKGAEPLYSAYDGLHTLVMVPTIQNPELEGTDREHVDFDPEHMTGCSPLTIDTSWQFITALMPEITVTNHGTLIPPPDPFLGPCTGAKFMHFIDLQDLVRPSTSPCP